jgi:hypothetical protein
MLVLGALNVALGLVSLGSDRIELSTAVAGGLVVAGVVIVAGGVLVWRGSRGATFAWFAVFLVLFNVQLAELVADAGDGASGVPDQPLPRLVVLGLLVVSLAIAAWRRRRSRPASA